MRAFFLYVLLSASGVHWADPEWSWSHPRPTGWTVTGMYFTDGQNGWMCTSAYPVETVLPGGEILQTNDGGAIWEVRYVCNTPLNDIFFADSQNGWACGKGGRVLRTTDGGVSWTEQTVSGSDLNALHFTDSMYGTIAGNNGVILRTPNGGVNWYAQSSGTSSNLYDAHFIDAETGWVCGTGASVLYTESGGAFWQQVSVSGSTGNSRQIHFTDDQNGWVAFKKSSGACMIFRSLDGGATWSLQGDNLGDIEDMDFYDSNHGMATGTDNVLTTENGGQTWQSQPPPMLHGTNSATYYSCSVPTASRGVTAGLYGLVREFTFPGSWNLLSSHVTGSGLTAVSSVGETHVWATTEAGQVLRSQNGGYSWTMHSVPSQVQSLRGICFVDQLNGYACGNGQGYGIVIKTTDGGTTWTTITPAGISASYLSSISFRSASEGVVAGASGALYYTHDGGATWGNAQVTSMNLLDATFAGTEYGWVVGQSGSVIRFDFDDNLYWSQISNTSGTLYGVFASDGQTAWAVGWNGTVIRTYNGGSNWTKIAETGNDYRDIRIFDGLHGYLSRLGGGLCYTADGGTTVTPVNDPILSRLKWFSFQNDELGWGVGTHGSVYRFGEPETGLESNEELIPGSPSRLSISPNPAIETAMAAFALNSQSPVELSVFDLTGRTVITLSEGTRPAGANQVCMDVSELPAGVYLVGLKSDEGLSFGRCVIIR